MSDRLYGDYPELYDAIQSGWDYDRDVAFVEAAVERHAAGGRRLLEVGCGTGEHTRRFVAGGFDVTAVDPAPGAVRLAREKCGGAADVRRDGLPDLAVDGRYDAVVAIRGVVNHVRRDRVGAALSAMADRLAEGGVLVFDNSPLPPEGNHPAIDVGTTDRGDWARIVQHVPTGDGHLDWRAVVFAPDGEWFVDRRRMTPLEDGRIAGELRDLGLAVETRDGYGEGDDRTVFLATPR